jgi:nitroreductase
MGHPVDDAAMDILFRGARTHSKWQSRPVTDEMLGDLYELLKWAPTSANAAPARLCNLGYGDPTGLYPRLPRLTFAEACSLL